MKQRTPYLAIMALGSMIVMLGILSCPASAGELDTLTLELGAIKPIAPDLTLDLGLSASVALFEIPEDFALLPGRPVYMDFLFVTSNGSSNPFLGASVGIYDDLRLGAAVWREDSARWTIYMVQPIVSF